MKTTNKIEVEYIDHMGDDLSVVNSARVSFKKSKDAIDNKDVKLIGYLAKHKHFTPFTHCSVTLKQSVPIFVARQIFKHVVGFTYNEESRRYINDEPVIYVPDVWRNKSSNGAKQGSDKTNNEIANKQDVKEAIKNLNQSAINHYNLLIEYGAAPEQARMVLPQSTMTNYFVTGSLFAWARMCKLRLDNHAQQETKDVAIEVDKILSKLYPASWKALMSD